MTDLLLARAERFPDRVAMNVNGTGGITYWEWQRRVNRTANGLLRAGVRRGDAIALLSGGMDWIDSAVVACLAVLSAGACGVHLHESYPQAELERRLAEGGVRGVIHGAGLRPPRRVGAWARTVADLDGGDETPVAVDLAPGDIADILHTSGTTGPAKGFTNPRGNVTFGRGPEGLRQFEKPTPMLAPMPLGTTSSATALDVAVREPGRTRSLSCGPLGRWTRCRASGPGGSSRTRSPSDSTPGRACPAGRPARWSRP
ncbi:AMP-binding protein [Streptomyces sp. NPDC127105]|uniref:AMP-binding protein n=1 Tax=Streptomyces sp. NPDC127105 TaxID=3345359 RepID=UPI0036461795